MKDKKRKRNDVIFVLLAYLSIFVLTGYTFPTGNTPYLVVDCNFGSNFIIAFTSDQSKYIVVDGNEVINTSSNTIYGYCSDSERITFPTYNTAYRSYNYQNQTPLQVSNILENHLIDYNTNSLFADHERFITVGLIGGLLLCGLLLVVKR